MKQEGYFPYWFCIKKKQSKVQFLYTGNQEIQKRGKENKKNYNKASSHVERGILCLLFACRITCANAFLKWRIHCWTVGAIPLKMRSFRCIQMLQDMVMRMSMKKGTWSCKQKSSRTEKGSANQTCNDMAPQHAVAKGQVMNKGTMFSTVPCWQQTQL